MRSTSFAFPAPVRKRAPDERTEHGLQYRLRHIANHTLCSPGTVTAGIMESARIVHGAAFYP